MPISALTIKGEGHSKNCVLFFITNKMFTLSWVTHRCFSFWSGCDPNEKEVKSSTQGAAISKGSWRPGPISVTSFRPRMCLFLWALVWLHLKLERASDSGDDNNGTIGWKMLCGVLVRNVQPYRRKENGFFAENSPSRSPKWKVHFAVQLHWTPLAEEEVYFLL